MCVCTSSTAEESWGEALASAICLLFTLPTACRSGCGPVEREGCTEPVLSLGGGNRASPPLVRLVKPSTFWRQSLRPSTAPFSLPVSVSSIGLSASEARSPGLCLLRPARALAGVPTGVCGPEGPTDSEGLPTPASPGRNLYWYEVLLCSFHGHMVSVGTEWLCGVGLSAWTPGSQCHVSSFPGLQQW